MTMTCDDYSSTETTMDHKEMSRRVLAVVFVWGFWLFWVAGGITCMTVHRIGRHHNSDYDCTGLWAAIVIWLFVSIFPIVLERWKHQRVSRRTTYEFLLTLVVVLYFIIPVIVVSPGDDTVYLGLPLMAGLTYSCFRLRQAGLDYLAPARTVDTAKTSRNAVLSTPPYPCHYH